MRSFSLTVEEIVRLVQPVRQAGGTTATITAVAPIQEALPGAISFLENTHSIAQMADSSYEKFVAGCRASVLILPENFVAAAPGEQQLHLFCKKPSLAFAQVCAQVEAILVPRPGPGIHPTAVVDREAKVHSSAHVGPMCVIGPGAEVHKAAVLHSGVIVRAHAVVGAGSELKSHVVVGEDCIIGARCILHSGVVIGSDGFGYVFDAGSHVKVPQIGNVVIHDDVEIGANTTIDRARMASTIIGAGTKIDNLVQIAHNVQVGRGCLLAAGVGLAGGAVLEDFVVMGGHSGAANNVRIGKGAKIASQGGVVSDVAAGQTVAGKPARDMKQLYRTEAYKNKLPELFARVAQLEEKWGVKSGAERKK